MSDEPTSPEGREPDPSPGDLVSSSLGGVTSTSGTGLVSLAGIVVLAVYLVFELIFREYFVAYAALMLAAVAVILPRVRRDSVEKFHAFSSLMKVVGYGLALIGVFELLDDIRFNGYDDTGSVVGALVAYAGYVMAIMGARSIAD